MKIRIFAFIISILMIVTIFTGCRNEEVPEAMICMDKFNYAWDMHFMIRIVGAEVYIDRTGARAIQAIDPRSPAFTPFYTDLIFVHSEEEAAGFPDNVIVAWPSEVTLWIIPEVHFRMGMDENKLAEWGTERDVLTFEEFGLSYPLAVADLVENWENVNVLFRSFTELEQSIIRGAAQRDFNQAADTESAATGE